MDDAGWDLLRGQITGTQAPGKCYSASVYLFVLSFHLLRLRCLWPICRTDANGAFHITLQARFLSNDLSKHLQDLQQQQLPSHQFEPKQIDAMKIAFAKHCPAGQSQLGEKEFRDVLRYVKRHYSSDVGRKNERLSLDNERLVFCSNQRREFGITDVRAEYWFLAFDNDRFTGGGYQPGRNRIDFREFIAGLSCMMKGTCEQKLQMAFRAYDRDGNGELNRDEFVKMIKSSLASQGVPEAVAQQYVLVPEAVFQRRC